MRPPRSPLLPAAVPAAFAGACVVLLSLGGCIDNSPGGQAARARHARFEELGDAYGDMLDEMKAAKPDVARLKDHAAKIDGLARDLPQWFTPGSGPLDNVRTEALAEAWTKPAEFKASADRFAAAAAALRQVAEGGSVPAIGASAKALGAACKDCHTRFREKE